MKKRKKTGIDTGGGAYVGGDVKVSGGEFVGRDKTVQGDQVSGDKIKMGDITGSKGIAVGHGARATVSEGDEYSGDFRGANVNIKSTLNRVTQSVGMMPLADDTTKAELEELIKQLTEALKQAPPEKEEEAETVAQLTESLVETASSEKPNKTMLQITGEGLKKAAENIAGVMPTVIGIVTQIVAAVARIPK